MKRINFSIIITLGGLLVLCATFLWGMEYLFVTRIVVMIFAIAHLIIELTKGYFISRKRFYIIFSVVSMLAIIVGIYIDNLFNKVWNMEKTVAIPIYVLTLIGILYKDLYGESQSDQEADG